MPHASYRSGLVPSSAELQYLKKCRQLDLYGVELHNVKGERGVQYQLGVSPRGVETFRNKRRVTVFYWPQITLVNYREQYLELKVRNKQGDVTSHKFEVMTSLLCKYVWKSIADHHVFYRLPQHTQASAWNKKYRYSGRTEAEVMQSEVEREEPEVARISSKRFPPRDNNNQQQATSRGTRKSSARSDAENLQPVNRGDDDGDGGESTWEEALHKNSMFRVSEKEKNVKYVTPKSERKERQRRLQTLSDNENRQRRHRSRTGRSSGEESDSPSKRRIRARQRRNRNQRAGSDVSEAPSMQRHHRRTNYHTDTEMLRRDSESRVPAHNTPTSPSHSEARSRRLKRLSREDELARQQLWQHIRKEVVDVTSSPELVGDISYTEVKTVGNPNPAPQRSNRHRGNRSRRSSKRASGTSQLSSIAPPPRDEMVAPLRVTTTVVHEHQRSDPPWKHPHPSKLDWDTRTPSLSIEDLSNQHRNNRKPRSSDLKLIYTQI